MKPSGWVCLELDSPTRNSGERGGSGGVYEYVKLPVDRNMGCSGIPLNGHSSRVKLSLSTKLTGKGTVSSTNRYTTLRWVLQSAFGKMCPRTWMAAIKIAICQARLCSSWGMNKAQHSSFYSTIITIAELTMSNWLSAETYQHIYQSLWRRYCRSWIHSPIKVENESNIWCLKDSNRQYRKI